MAYGDFKVLPRKTVSDKVLRDKAFKIAKGIRFLLCYWHFNRYTWVSPLKDKKSITNAFQKILV